jgi:hypothetical protein
MLNTAMKILFFLLVFSDDGMDTQTVPQQETPAEITVWHRV